METTSLKFVIQDLGCNSRQLEGDEITVIVTPGRVRSTDKLVLIHAKLVT